MKHGILATALVLSFITPIASASAQSGSATTSLGSVTLSRKVTADGQPLAAGTYQVRLTTEQARGVVGQTPEAERYVEFVRGGKVVGRELATIVSDADAKTILKVAKPAPGGARVELLKGDDYIRVWINRGGNNYIIHLPPAA
ncbi:MAG: hypothetical protein ABMA15_06700 [Vicinamibacterales bacterium]